MRVRRGDAWQETTFAELGAAAREIAGGLIALGVRPGDRVAILGSTRPEWTLADCGALCAGATVVPVYHTNSPEECQYVLAHSAARVLVCEDACPAGQGRERARAGCPRSSTSSRCCRRPARARSGRSAGDRRSASTSASVAVAADDAATIVYTSGTTGPPKGCVLTHANLVATMRMYEDRLRDELRPGVVIFMFLPLAHSLARVVQLVALDVGATLELLAGRPEAPARRHRRRAPDVLPVGPARVREDPCARARRGRGVVGGSPPPVRLGDRHGRPCPRGRAPGREVGPVLRASARLADRLVLSRVRALFGGELRLGLTGAAPIGREVLDFFDACGVLILEGYGMTETCAAATLNTPGDFRLGTVGRPLPGSEVALAEDGEMLMRGPHVFGGYHRDEDSTRATFDDGWLRSGDLGEIDADGFVAITGRKKDLIITSSGKNISPTNLETALSETRWISQAVVYGDNRPYLVALLTIDPDELQALADRAGVPAEPVRMAADERVHAVLQEAVDEVNRRVARIEQIKRFAVLDHDLSQAEGELTPTMKVKRAAVYRRYHELFERLYE